MRERIDTIGDSPGRERRSAPLGRPVVPELSTIVRPGLAGGSAFPAGAEAMSSSSSEPGPPAATAWTPCGTALRKSANSASATTTSTSCSRTTSTSCPVLIPVFSRTRSLPRLLAATSVSTIPRWLRQSTATRGAAPNRPRAAASRSVRASTSP